MRIRSIVWTCLILGCTIVATSGALVAQQLLPATTLPPATVLDTTALAFTPGDQTEHADRPRYTLPAADEPGNATLGAVFGAAVGYVIADTYRGHTGHILLGALIGSILFYQIGIG